MSDCESLPQRGRDSLCQGSSSPKLSAEARRKYSSPSWRTDGSKGSLRASRQSSRSKTWPDSFTPQTLPPVVMAFSFGAQPARSWAYFGLSLPAAGAHDHHNGAEQLGCTPCAGRTLALAHDPATGPRSGSHDGGTASMTRRATAPLARMLPRVMGGPAWDRGRVRMPDWLPRRLGYREELHEPKSGLAFRTDRVVSSSPEC
jgi:hypothetical protein